MKQLFWLKERWTKRVLKARFVVNAFMQRLDEFNIWATTPDNSSITTDNSQ